MITAFIFGLAIGTIGMYYSWKADMKPEFKALTLRAEKAEKKAEIGRKALAEITLAFPGDEADELIETALEGIASMDEVV